MSKRDKLEIMTQSLLIRSKQFKSQEQTGVEICKFVDDIMGMFVIPFSSTSACLCDTKPVPMADNTGRLRCKNCGIPIIP